jgi:hypothetical protein
MNLIHMRKISGILIAILFSFLTNSCKPSSEVTILFDQDEATIVFAAEDLKDILVGSGVSVALKSLTDISDTSPGTKIVIAKNDALLQETLTRAGGAAVGTLGEQEYALRVTGAGSNRSYWAIGGDRIGAMYGGIHMGELVKAFGLDSIKDENHSPYIGKRGIKFNIPLGERQPSHDDRGTSAQSNIVHMWDFSFWTEYLDQLAKQRYNVLSLWNQHPFPSMVKLTDYPNVALDDVYNKSGKVKEITIDEKIDLWKRIMEYAYDRGIELYIITWNIHMNGANGKYGIGESADNVIAKDYLRKSVEALFLTYPRLAGIGITAGENMNELSVNEMSNDEKEEWLWNTYGEGVQDVQRVQKERHIRFIHRYWFTSFDKIESRFGQLKDGFDMSFKYARARMYSSYAPPYAEKELFPILPEGIATWWNVRNDDIYNLRWGNPEYVKQFILNFPQGERTAGYYMGSDRFVWGRESISKNPSSPPMLENEKHWYSFWLWGRLGYDPETPTSLIKGMLQERFPGVASDQLYDAWGAASEIIPLVNKFHWFSWDYLWWPEAGISTGFGAAIDGYHNIFDFIDAPVMDESGFMTIKDYSNAFLEGQSVSEITPLEVADMLEDFASTALENVANMQGGEKNELTETLGDIRAMSHLGNYYANKIRGATYLKLYQDSNQGKYKELAIQSLEESLEGWQAYATVLESQYNKMNISMQGLFDWDKIEEEVKEDIKIAVLQN